jgi:hypothetical protein
MSACRSVHLSPPPPVLSVILWLLAIDYKLKTYFQVQTKGKGAVAMCFRATQDRVSVMQSTLGLSQGGRHRMVLTNNCVR